MARVTRLEKGFMRTKDVKNLGWFFRKARTTPIERFDMWRQRSLRGVVVTIHDKDGNTASIKLAPKGVIGRAEGERGGYDWTLI